MVDKIEKQVTGAAKGVCERLWHVACSPETIFRYSAYGFKRGISGTANAESTTESEVYSGMIVGAVVGMVVEGFLPGLISAPLTMGVSDPSRFVGGAVVGALLPTAARVAFGLLDRGLGAGVGFVVGNLTYLTQIGKAGNRNIATSELQPRRELRRKEWRPTPGPKVGSFNL